MNNINKKLTALMLVSVSAISAMAQESSTGYFMENYNMKWQMNPALGNRNGYVGFPGLGNINVAVNGNLKPTDIFYSRDGKTVLFTNPNVSVKEAMGNFSTVNRLSQNLKLNVIQFGFKAFGGYNNLALNVKEDISFDAPGDLFGMVKEGLTNKVYDIKHFRASANAYAELALNHSRDIKWVPGLRAGVSLKFLIPVAFAEAKFNELALDLGTDSWKVRSNAEMKMALKGIRYETELSKHTGKYYVSGVNTDDISVGVNGFGFGVDLGATYEWKDFVFSLAFTDLGMINYNSLQLATTGGTKEFTTAGTALGIDDDDEGWDNMEEKFAPLYELEDKGDVGSTSIGLEGTFRAGVDYKFPFYNKLHFGLMNTTRMSTIFPMTEFRLSANVEPVKGIAASVSAAAGTYGANFGFLLSLGNKGINFMIGMDYASLKVDKNFLPLTSNCDLHMGINFPF